MIQARPNNLAYINRDRGYRHTERDPQMEELCHIIDKSGMSIGEIIDAVLDASNQTVTISYATIANWLNGKTRRPQNFTMTWVAFALGYKREWTRI